MSFAFLRDSSHGEGLHTSEQRNFANSYHISHLRSMAISDLFGTFTPTCTSETLHPIRKDCESTSQLQLSYFQYSHLNPCLERLALLAYLL